MGGVRGDWFMGGPFQGYRGRHASMKSAALYVLTSNPSLTLKLIPASVYVLPIDYHYRLQYVFAIYVALAYMRGDSYFSQTV